MQYACASVRFMRRSTRRKTCPGTAGGEAGGEGGAGPTWKSKHSSAPDMVAPSKSTLQSSSPQFSSIVTWLPSSQPSPHESFRQIVCAPGSRHANVSSIEPEKSPPPLSMVGPSMTLISHDCSLAKVPKVVVNLTSSQRSGAAGGSGGGNGDRNPETKSKHSS